MSEADEEEAADPATEEAVSAAVDGVDGDEKRSEFLSLDSIAAASKQVQVAFGCITTKLLAAWLNVSELQLLARLIQLVDHFEHQAAAAKFVGVSPPTFNKRLRNNGLSWPYPPSE